MGIISSFLYFFLVLDTGSLNSTGSNLVEDFFNGMYPKIAANVFMHVCLSRKCSGSDHGDLKNWDIIFLQSHFFHKVFSSKIMISLEEENVYAPSCQKISESSILLVMHQIRLLTLLRKVASLCTVFFVWLWLEVFV